MKHQCSLNYATFYHSYDHSYLFYLKTIHKAFCISLFHEKSQSIIRKCNVDNIHQPPFLLGLFLRCASLDLKDDQSMEGFDFL